MSVVSESPLVVVFIVPGEAVPKGRPRYTMVNGYPRAYTPDKTKEYEAMVTEAYKTQCKSAFFDPEMPVELDIKVMMEPPKTASQKRKMAMLNGDILPVHAREDLDNLVKSISDGLNGVAFADDKQITRLRASKEYGRQACAIVALREIVKGASYADRNLSGLQDAG